MIFLTDNLRKRAIFSCLGCSLAKSCVILCDPMDCSMPGSSGPHYLGVCSNSCPVSQRCYLTLSSWLPGATPASPGNKRPRLIPWVGKISWRRKWQLAPISNLPGKFHGQRSLADYSPWVHEELNTTEHTHPCLFMQDKILKDYELPHLEPARNAH